MREFSGQVTPPDPQSRRSGSGRPAVCLCPAFPLVLLTALAAMPLICGAASELEYRITYEQCTAPPPVLVKKSGATIQNVFSICMSTNRGLVATFDNADKLFIGDASTFRDFGTACYSMDLVLYVQKKPDGSYNFIQGDLPPEFGKQAWDLTLWPRYNPDFPGQEVNFTVSNFGPSNLQFSGINYQDLGLPADFQFTQENVTTVTLDYSKVRLTYNTLPILQQYLFGVENQIVPGVQAVVLVIYPTDARANVSITISYALVGYDPSTPDDEWNFLLHESTYIPPQAPPLVSSGRRLLVAAATNKAPAAACNGAKCVPASPIPAGCKTASCKTKCGCFTK